jgi:MFS family permease
MIVLDVTIVNVALPSIKADLGFSEATLAWVVNAYVLTFGGFLLLGGRIADLLGRRLIFTLGLACSRWRRYSVGLPKASSG